MNRPLRILVVVFAFLGCAAQGLAGAHGLSFCLDSCCQAPSTEAPGSGSEHVSCCGPAMPDPRPQAPRCPPDRSGCGCLAVPAGPATARADDTSTRRAPEAAKIKPAPALAAAGMTSSSDEPLRTAHRSHALGRASPAASLRTIRLLI